MPPTYDAITRLSRIAARLHADAGSPALPALWFFTEPDRIADPVTIAERLPRGCGVVFRHFGRPNALETAHSLAGVARRRGLTLLIGADPKMARAVGAAGVHLPERELGRLRRLRLQNPGWILTVAAHSLRAARRAHAAGADAVFTSPVFPTRSASARRALGPNRFRAIVAGTRGPVIALGGVNATTAPRLLGSRAAGLAAVDAFGAPDTQE